MANVVCEISVTQAPLLAPASEIAGAGAVAPYLQARHRDLHPSKRQKENSRHEMTGDKAASIDCGDTTVSQRISPRQVGKQTRPGR